MPLCRMYASTCTASEHSVGASVIDKVRKEHGIESSICQAVTLLRCSESAHLLPKKKWKCNAQQKMNA